MYPSVIDEQFVDKFVSKIADCVYNSDTFSNYKDKRPYEHKNIRITFVHFLFEGYLLMTQVEKELIFS